MWCPSCRADVAAELSTDNRRLMCARCQSELGIAAGVLPVAGASQRTVEMERDARDLLARWSAQSLIEKPVSSASASATPKSPSAIDFPTSKPELRFDRPQASAPAPSAAFLSALKDASIAFPLERRETVDTHQDLPVAKIQPRHSRFEEKSATDSQALSPRPPHQPVVEQPLSAVHDQPAQERVIHEFTAPSVPIRSRWTTLLGQLCAYSGVGLLTCGSVLAMWSFFGGPPNYMPTGWIAAAIGQMLLLLGIVTLISNGLDQTIKEVTWRIDHLAEEVHHMGLALDDLEDEARTTRLEQSRPRNEQADHGQSREAA